MNTANWVARLFMRASKPTGSGPCSRRTRRPICTISTARHLPSATPPTRPRLCAAKSACSSGPRHGSVAQMLTMLFETGHPWITFKDPCNLRSPQQHAGVIHSSNLCTEITLNTSDDEVAVCNLGSVNLLNHIRIVSWTTPG